MITGLQIRCARAAIKLSIESLAEMSGVSSRTIKRMEAYDGQPSSTRANISAVKTCLESAGIEFIGTPDDGPGVRIYTASPKP
ncbi:helix-turn-helix domain-containing protein [Boseongicola aestuarii]|uniref:helix-turn-helix domain-containing protein n=1 Tax=Boseongicola aestuarii TaxID=1470561 RepID=UPI000B9466DF